MTKTTHTHRGTCQACGSVQAVDNKNGLLAKHGYKVVYGAFQFICNAAGHKPAEHDVTYTHSTIAWCLESAVHHDESVLGLKAGLIVPETFERWNRNKVVTKHHRNGSSYQDKGGYDTLPIAQATADERKTRINGQIRHHELEAEGLRAHVVFLRRDVLPRLGQPLYANEELSKTALSEGMRFTHEGSEHEIVERAYSTWGTERPVGWYVIRVGAEASRKMRWTAKEIRDAMNPKPAKVEGTKYPTKQARKDALDKLSRAYDKAHNAIQAIYLAMPHEARTEAKTAVYYGPYQLSHWRPKHSAAVLKEFPEAAALVAEIDELVKAREAVKAAP